MLGVNCLMTNRNKWLQVWTPKTTIMMENQRTGETVVFHKNEILLQPEGFKNNIVMVRGKYPNDAYFSSVNISELDEI